KIKGAVYGDDFWKVLYRYRVNLNLMRPHNPSSHNMRSFEIPGVGGIGLFPDTPDHKDYFEREGIVFLSNTVQDCIARADEILSMPADQAKEFRKKARAVSLANGYDYLSRTKQAVKMLEGKIIENKL
ncbi:MAG TPA: glycosyltransferase, partial [Ignavibacteriaceae bacterium]